MTDYYPDSDRHTTDDRLDVLIKALDATDALSHALLHPTLEPSKYGYSKGKKYARVYYDMSNGQRFVAFFVDMVSGDVWKADGWKKPALNFVRGNVMTPEGRHALTLGKMSETGYFYPAF